MVVVGYSSRYTIESSISDRINTINTSYKNIKGIIELPKGFISNNNDEYNTMRNKLVKYLDERTASSFIVEDKRANERRKAEILNDYDSYIGDIKYECNILGISEKDLVLIDDVVDIDQNKKEEIIKKRTAYTISKPRDIELYNKVLDVVKLLNSLKEDLEGVRCGRNRVTPIGENYTAHIIEVVKGEYKVNANVMANLD